MLDEYVYIEYIIISIHNFSYHHFSFSINEISILFGLSIGSPYARDQILLESTPIALETPNTTV